MNDPHTGLLNLGEPIDCTVLPYSEFKPSFKTIPGPSFPSRCLSR
jgi:hypothetical protein